MTDPLDQLRANRLNKPVLCRACERGLQLACGFFARNCTRARQRLEETVRGESVEGQSLIVRSILQPDAGCDVLFVPRRFAAAHEYLHAVDGKPVLTVGESPEFVQEGGIVNFFLDGKRVRFEINPTAATRVNLRISSRLLQLARLVGPT